ncbi:MAG: hypothetical protein K5979_06545 [Ruminococcus sp.]|nr:hypothetical protein [Ruminococcus sp.]
MNFNKEENNYEKTGFWKKTAAGLLSLLIVAGCTPLTNFGEILIGDKGIVAFADGAYADYLQNTQKAVKFNNIDWYIIEDNSTALNAGTVTLLSKDPIGMSVFNNPGITNPNVYNG